MFSRHSRALLRRLLALFLSSTMTAPAVGQNSPTQTENPGFTIRTRTEVVVVNLTARDRNGAIVKDLKAVRRRIGMPPQEIFQLFDRSRSVISLQVNLGQQ